MARPRTSSHAIWTESWSARNDVITNPSSSVFAQCAHPVAKRGGVERTDDGSSGPPAGSKKNKFQTRAEKRRGRQGLKQNGALPGSGVRVFAWARCLAGKRAKRKDGWTDLRAPERLAP